MVHLVHEFELKFLSLNNKFFWIFRKDKKFFEKKEKNFLRKREKKFENIDLSMWTKQAKFQLKIYVEFWENTKTFLGKNKNFFRKK